MVDKDEARIEKHKDMIMQHREVNREQHVKKLVSNARAIITNQIGLPLGVLKMTHIMSNIHYIRPLTEIDLEVFREYFSKTSGIPLGSDRLHYNRDYLKQLDLQLDELTRNYKEKIIDKCFEIIEKFSITDESQQTDEKHE